MGQKLIGVTVAAFLVLVSGCGSPDQQGDDRGPETPPSATAAPAVADAPEEPTDSPTTPPAATEAGAASPAPVDPPVALDLPTDVPSDVMLGDTDLYTADAANLVPVRAETEGVVPWYLVDFAWPETCVDQGAVPAAAMRTVLVTDERNPYLPDVQQVAVFADSAQAEQVFDEATALLEGCDRGWDMVQHSHEAFSVGDTEGFAFVTDYSQLPADGVGGSNDVGNYLALFRRGNAISFLWTPDRATQLSVDQERAVVTEKAAKAWPLLCRYDPAGC